MTTPRQPKRFGETAAAKVDTAEKKRVPISTYVGEELLLRGWRWAKSENGEYMILRIQRHGESAEEVNCGSETVMRQMQAFDAEDFEDGVIAWLHPSKEEYKRGSALWFANDPPENKHPLSEGPVPKRGD